MNREHVLLHLDADGTLVEDVYLCAAAQDAMTTTHRGKDTSSILNSLFLKPLFVTSYHLLFQKRLYLVLFYSGVVELESHSSCESSAG